jgi:hypothetical protein
MKVATVFTLLLVSTSAFSPPQFATRAVGSTKAVPKKAVNPFSKKKAAAAPAKSAPAKTAPAKKKASISFSSATSNQPPASKGYPSFAEKAQNFKLGGGKINGGGAERDIKPVFLHPTLNTDAVPDFDYKELAKLRKTPQTQEFAYDDGLSELERKQKGTIPAFLTGSARSRVEKSEIRDDIDLDSDYPFGLSADRFQLLFISIFSLFALVGCLSGNISLD